MTITKTRKLASEEHLRGLGVSINDHLPEIESDEEVVLRTPQEVAKRVLCLTVVSSIAFGDAPDVIRDYVRRAGVEGTLSEGEAKALRKSSMTQKEKSQFSWRVEAIVPLLWALSQLANIDKTSQQCGLSDVYGAIPGIQGDLGKFINEATLRDKREILDMADWIYRAHWATREKSIDQSVQIGPLDAGVVQEWHQALNWLICYDDEDDWDNVPTDT